MALETSPHVSRLRRFQPFQPDSAELIYEQSDPNEPTFEMAALRYLERLVEEPSVGLVVLTGDAGHGKTSLSARLLERLGRSPQEAASAISLFGDATAPIATTRSGRALWLLRDLSELDIDQASQLLVRMASASLDGVAVVCANEGRLRSAVVRDQSGEARVITQTLEQGISDGTVSNVNPRVHVINLNYQSVAPDGAEGLVDWTVRTWAVDKRRWRPCAKCDARDVCPILANHQELTAEVGGPERRVAVRELFATAERAGSVVTTRQALALVAYAVTGGLTCEDVHKRFRRSAADKSWQYQYLYHQALFGDLLPRQKRRQVPSFREIRSLDPGHVALRVVDDYLEPDAAVSKFLPPIPAVDEGTPRSRRDAQRESETLRNLMTFLRRRDYFQSDPDSRLARMGLEAGRDFAHATTVGSKPSVEVRDTLLRGLEAVQGVHRAGEQPDFLVLDPAFFTHRSRAAVIARRLQGRNVTLVSQRDQWIAQGNHDPQLPMAVDWSSRRVYLRLWTEERVVAIPLDLMRFELLFRWAAGLSSRSQHEAEIRSLSGSLAALAPETGAPDDIGVLVGGQRRILTIDVGERIRSGGA